MHGQRSYSNEGRDNELPMCYEEVSDNGPKLPMTHVKNSCSRTFEKTSCCAWNFLWRLTSTRNARNSASDAESSLSK
jgi:hypothetical protein